MNKNITVGYTIHNKVFLIPQIIEGLKKSFSSEDEFIFLFDNCTDGSESVAIRLPISSVNLVYDDGDLFETKANNKILEHFMETSKNDTIILFQDDQICNDPKIKEKIERVQKIVPNLGLMGGRSGYELTSTQFPEVPVNKVSNWEHKEDQYGQRLVESYQGLINGSFVKGYGYSSRTFLNRGPIVFTRQLIEKVGYLDEAYYPQQCDDLDYCARCKYQYGLENIVFQCDVISKLEWGSTRRKDSNLYKLTKGKHVKKNWNLFCERWGKYFVK